jgi:hypothetical protein
MFFIYTTPLPIKVLLIKQILIIVLGDTSELRQGLNSLPHQLTVVVTVAKKPLDRLVINGAVKSPLVVASSVDFALDGRNVYLGIVVLPQVPQEGVDVTLELSNTLESECHLISWYWVSFWWAHQTRCSVGFPKKGELHYNLQSRNDSIGISIFFVGIMRLKAKYLKVFDIVLCWRQVVLTKGVRYPSHRQHLYATHRELVYKYPMHFPRAS